MEGLTKIYNEHKNKLNNLSDMYQTNREKYNQKINELSDMYQTNREKYNQKINDLSKLYETHKEKIVYIKQNSKRFTKLILVLLVFLLLIIGIFLVITGLEGSPNGEISSSLISKRFFENVGS